jgi:asparagine synthase (glutamine-hydrolysing)
MCGIALCFDRTGDGVAPARLARMTRMLARRGPDDEAYVVGDWASGRAELRGGQATAPAAPLPSLVESADARWSIGIGVRRLAVRDPGARARMPMTDGRGLWLAYNGELYGVDALRATLRGLGYRFTTTGDAEVFLAAWRTWGPACLSRLAGMWAAVVWDAPRRQLWCVRDALGIKPLYVVEPPGAILVASTPGALVAGLGARPMPHAPAVAEYLVSGLVDHGEATCFAGIRRVGAGCCLELQDGRLVERRWATYGADEAPADRRDRVERFHDALDAAIGTHLESDRPVGATLSGGLDSGTIVLGAAARRHAGGSPPLQLFTAGFADPDLDERDAAATVAERSGYPLHVTDVGAPPDGTLAGDVSTFLDGLDEPVVSSSMYAQWAVMRGVAAHGVTVVVDGQGADELLCGYPALIGPAIADEVRAGGPARAWTALEARVERVHASRAALVARSAVALLPDRLGLTVGRFVTRSTRALSPELAASWDAAPPAEAEGFAPLAPGRLPAARARLLAVHLPQLLRFLDVNSMAWSVEARVPFLDRAVVSAGLALDGRDLWRDGFQKWVLRDPRRSRLPDSIRLRPRKRAFEAPEAPWFRGPLRAWLHDVLAPATVARQGLLAPAAVAAGLAALDRDGPTPPDLWRWANLTWWMARS